MNNAKRQSLIILLENGNLTEVFSELGNLSLSENDRDAFSSLKTHYEKFNADKISGIKKGDADDNVYNNFIQSLMEFVREVNEVENTTVGSSTHRDAGDNIPIRKKPPYLVVGLLILIIILLIYALTKGEGEIPLDCPVSKSLKRVKSRIETERSDPKFDEIDLDVLAAYDEKFSVYMADKDLCDKKETHPLINSEVEKIIKILSK